ncbi:MAG: TRAP transporter large permease subunit [Thiohalocapsa sp. PB-PSB1]|nr:MAG: TRAP transporter large permease subunit [Thiohalocapsa sp. PB-PSB1]HCS92634.1 C4-dicarboxylate ABC transporter [Chromatiaceae bacterium]
MMIEIMPLLLFIAVGAMLLLGYPVAMSLGGTALLFALFGYWFDLFDPAFIGFLPNRLYGIMTSEILIAVPLFVFMGVMLERSRVAEDLLDTMSLLFGPMRGGLGISVIVVGMLLAASTGIVGATVVTMGLLSLPTMLRRHYDPGVSAGTICAAGTLGQIIPPSIILVLLAEVLSAAHQQATRHIWPPPDPFSVGDLFFGALIPGLMLVIAYIGYMLALALFRPASVPAIPADQRPTHDWHFWLRVVQVLLPPLGLIVAVLGSILYGVATTTEAASVGAIGALLLAALKRQLDLATLRAVMRQTTVVTSMVFLIFIGAAIFALVFRGFSGDEMVTDFLTDLPGGTVGAVILVMLVMFFLGFILDFIEITFVVVPIVGPVLFTMGLDPVWLGVMIAINLQTSFLTPPFGFSLFYLRGVASAEVSTVQIYRGVLPFIVLQLLMLIALALFPQIATWLPNLIY